MSSHPVHTYTGMLDYLCESEKKMDIKLIIWGPHLGSRPQLWEPLVYRLMWTKMMIYFLPTLHSVSCTPVCVNCKIKSRSENIYLCFQKKERKRQIKWASIIMLFKVLSAWLLVQCKEHPSRGNPKWMNE